MKVMLIVNDKSKFHLMEKFFISEQIECDFFECENAALDAIHNQGEKTYDIVVVDNSFDKVDCYQLCELMKKMSGVPIVMISDDQEKVSESKAFDIGCSDYIKSPYTFDILTRRLKNSIKKMGNLNLGKKAVFEDFIIDPNNRIVISQGHEIKLSNKEFAIVNLLTQNPDKTFSRNEIIEHVWQSSDKEKHRIVDSHIKNIRKKTRTSYIETVSNIGYRLKRNTVSFD